jgi:DNA-binding transcriptional regulator YiaG
MRKIYKSEPFMVIHEMAQDLYEIGAITEEEMREYDADCLVPEAVPQGERPLERTLERTLERRPALAQV